MLTILRGSEGSYQRWADIVGDTSFTFVNLLKFFKRSIEFTAPNYAKRGAGSTVHYDPQAFSKTGGPLHVSYSNYWPPITTFIADAFVKLGLKPVDGFNSGNLLGFAEFTSTLEPEAETRSSSETSFLQEAIKHSALQVYQQTLAERILFSAEKKAVGVSVSTAELPYVLSARREVILAAGVVSLCKAKAVPGLVDLIVSSSDLPNY